MELPAEMYKIKVAGFEFSFAAADLAGYNIIKTSPLHYNLISNNQPAEVVITGAIKHDEITVEVEGESFQVVIKNALQQQLEEMGFDKVSNKQLKEIKAPMPGLVISIAVQEGQDVNEGDKLLTLEAMKMENSITVKAPVKIKKILVSSGQAVEKGQVLVEFE